MLLTSMAFVAVSAVIAIELFLRLPFWSCAQIMLRTSRKAAATVSSKHISDQWKEKALLSYSGTLAGQSLKLAAMFLAVILVVMAFAAGADFFLQPSRSSLQALASWPGLITASVVAIIYIPLRKRVVQPGR